MAGGRLKLPSYPWYIILTLGAHVPLELPGHRGVLLYLDSAPVVPQFQVLHVIREEDVCPLYVPES